MKSFLFVIRMENANYMDRVDKTAHVVVIIYHNSFETESKPFVTRLFNPLYFDVIYEIGQSFDDWSVS